MIRRILAVILGVVAAIGTISLNEIMVNKIFPFPSDNEIRSTEAIRHFMENASVINYLMILFGYMVGCFLGGLVATLIDKREKAYSALIVGAVIFASGIMNIIQLPGQATWFIITSQIMYIPCSLIGYFMIRKNKI